MAVLSHRRSIFALVQTHVIIRASAVKLVTILTEQSTSFAFYSFASCTWCPLIVSFACPVLFSNSVLGKFLKPLWLLRLCCLKPIAHRCMVVNCGRRRFSFHLISWKLHIMMSFDCYLMNLDGAVHLRCLYITMFPRLMLLFVNWFMPYGVGLVITIVLMFWLINCSHQTFILSLNYLNFGAMQLLY